MISAVSQPISTELYSLSRKLSGVLLRPMSRTVRTALFFGHVPAAPALFADLARESKAHLREQLLLFARCFPENFPFGYSKCCRDPGGQWYQDHMETWLLLAGNAS